MFRSVNFCSEKSGTEISVSMHENPSTDLWKSRCAKCDTQVCKDKCSAKHYKLTFPLYNSYMYTILKYNYNSIVLSRRRRRREAENDRLGTHIYY